MPPPSRLEAAVRNLAASGRHRALIGFVERWSAYDDPSAMARLAEARALLALGQVDRAWIRVQDLARDPDATSDTLALAASILVARGWHQKAREYLTRALVDAPDDPEIQRLWDRAAEPSVEPEDPSERRLQEAGDSDTAESLVELAKAHATRGRSIVARGILERVVHAHPEHAAALDVLWALDGDLAEETRDLMELTETYAPVQLMLGDIVDENTESITQETLRAELDMGEDSGSHQFPSLFRSDADPGFDGAGDELTDEVTQSLAHAGGPESLSTIGADTLPSDFDSDADTRIVRVRGRDGQPENLHQAFDTPAAGGFDLEAYRREMGMTPPAAFDPALEDEDDDLVVLTGRETLPSAPPRIERDPTQSQISREVAHLIGDRQPRPSPPPALPPDPVADTPAPSRQDRAAPGIPAVEASSAPDAVPSADEPPDPPSRPLWPWLVVLGVTAFLALTTLSLVVLTLSLR